MKQVNEELKETRARLIESEKLAAIGEATAHIAHRILNPLTTIMSSAELAQLARDGEDEADRDVTYLKRIQGEAERIKTIIRGVLTYSRPFAMDKKRTDLNELLEEALGRVEYISSKHGVDIHKHLSPDPPKVMVDELQLKEAFVNVLMNSLDAMRRGGNLTISTSVRSSELKSHPELIEVSVTDDGTGISEENLDKVFQPFFTTKNPQDGTGLGLSITYGIIRNHDGEIDVTSEYGHGATVTIYLPAG
jgi:signal transduction histidine kinase